MVFFEEALLKYVIGDINANIQVLMGDEGVVDPLALKWNALANLGFDEEVAAGLALF